MNCPICQSNMSTLQCACGYDASRDYAKYPTFGPVGKVLPPSALRSRRAPKDALRCEKCGGTAFTIRVPDNSRICQSCGWSPDPKPHIECTCGGRYFLVRASDGALMCPLCSRDILLDALIARVRPASRTVSIPAKEVPAKAPLKSTPTSMPALPTTPRPADAQPKQSLLDRYSKKTAAAPAPTIITAIAAGACHTVALYSDGQVRAVGDGTKTQCHVHRWENITAIAAGNFHTVGLRRNGTVVATGSNSNGQCNVHTWTDVVAIAAGATFTVGLHKDGSLLIAGSNYGKYETLQMRRLKAIAAGSTFIVGLRTDGAVVTTHLSVTTRSAVGSWTDITAIAAGNGHIIGLSRSGYPVAAGETGYGQCLVNWPDIQSIAAGHNHTVALRKDGTTVAAGHNLMRQCTVGGWRDIVALAAGQYHTVGLKANGSLVATGDNKHGQCDVAALHR